MAISTVNRSSGVTPCGSPDSSESQTSTKKVNVVEVESHVGLKNAREYPPRLYPILSNTYHSTITGSPNNHLNPMDSENETSPLSKFYAAIYRALTRLKNIFCCLLCCCDIERLINFDIDKLTNKAKVRIPNFNELDDLTVIYHLNTSSEEESTLGIKMLASSTVGFNDNLKYYDIVSMVIDKKDTMDLIINGEETFCDALVRVHTSPDTFYTKWKTIKMKLLHAKNNFIIINDDSSPKLFPPIFSPSHRVFYNHKPLIVELLKQGSDITVIVNLDVNSKRLSPGFVWDVKNDKYQCELANFPELNWLESKGAFMSVYKLLSRTQKSVLATRAGHTISDSELDSKKSVRLTS
ncbi:MAG: hypothetical protein KAG53_10850 [Endozoicomonadaceae bacterium]|nr:hypothetical protein [Endozoicomonadaceae bacterium]